MDLKTFADTFLRHRAAIAVAVMLLTLAAAVGVSRIGFDDNPRAVFRADDEDFRLMEEVFDQFGTDDATAYLLVHSETLFSRQSLSDLRRLTQEVRDTKGVETVTSLTDERILLFDPTLRPLIPIDLQTASEADISRAKQDALQHPLTAGQLVSANAEYALIIVRLRGDNLAISEIQPIDERLDRIAERYSTDSSLDVRVTGLPSIRVDAFTNVQNESAKFTIECAIVAFAMAALIFRGWQMVVTVCAAALTGALWTVGALGLVGEQITVLSVVLPTLVMVVGFTDAVHLVVDIRHSRAAGLPPPTAARDALRHLTVACGLTSLTTAVGFASLGVTRTEIVRRFGLACGAGAVLTFVAVITIVPLLGSTKLGEGMLPPRGGQRIDSWISAAGLRLGDFVVKHRWLITTTAIVLTVYMGLTVRNLQPDNRIVETLPDNSEPVRTLQVFDEQFGGILPSFVVVEWPENVSVRSPEFRKVMEDVHRACQKDVAVGRPFSVLNVMRAIPGGDISLLPRKATRRILDLDARRAIVSLRSPARGIAYYSQAFPKLQQDLVELEQKHPGFRFRLTGSGVVASKNLGQMISDLASSLGLASVVIFATLSIVFRSFRIGLICLIPNALPLLLTASLLVWTGESLRFSGVIVFCICLGIAVDDTIHLVTRFQRELPVDGDVPAALRRSVKAVGSALIITTLVLVAGFSVTVTSSIPGNRMFGRLSCVAIASALVGDLVVLPAMLACFIRSRKQTVD